MNTLKLLFHCILVLHNHIKAQALTFYLILVLKVIKVYSKVSLFFISIVNKFSMKKFVV